MIDLIEDVISCWLHSKGYFLIQNLKVGLKEIDILAVKLSGNKIVEKAHIEVQCSDKPICILGHKYVYEKDVKKGIDIFMIRKFDDKKVVAFIENIIGEGYEKWLITGKQKDEKSIKEIKRRGVRVVRVWDIFEKLLQQRRKKSLPYKTATAIRYEQLLSLSRRMEK